MLLVLNSIRHRSYLTRSQENEMMSGGGCGREGDRMCEVLVEKKGKQEERRLKGKRERERARDGASWDKRGYLYQTGRGRKKKKRERRKGNLQVRGCSKKTWITLVVHIFSTTNDTMIPFVLYDTETHKVFFIFRSGGLL